MKTETIITIRYRWIGDDIEHEGDVVIGDGNTTYDENYPFDSRIFFYFHDQNEFDEFKVRPVDFIIL